MHDAPAVREPGDDDVEEASDAGGDGEDVDRQGSGNAIAHGRAEPRARCTKRCSSVSRWGKSETSRPPLATMARTAASAESWSAKVRTVPSSRSRTRAPSWARRARRSGGTFCAWTSI